eukprot:3127260-Prorocentrum_lima.AAC.1
MQHYSKVQDLLQKKKEEGGTPSSNKSSFQSRRTTSQARTYQGQAGSASGREPRLEQDDEGPDHVCTGNFGTQESCSTCEDT